MQILYAARYAWAAELAQRIPTWDEDRDKGIYRLMCYIHSTLHWRQMGRVGPKLSNMSFHLYTDAEFASDFFEVHCGDASGQPG